MLTKNNGTQQKMHMVTIEQLVPENHFLRKLDSLVSFEFIYDKVSHLYCENNGRPSINPIVIINIY